MVHNARAGLTLTRRGRTTCSTLYPTRSRSFDQLGACAWMLCADRCSLYGVLGRFSVNYAGYTSGWMRQWQPSSSSLPICLPSDLPTFVTYRWMRRSRANIIVPVVYLSRSSLLKLDCATRHRATVPVPVQAAGRGAIRVLAVLRHAVSRHVVCDCAPALDLARSRSISLDLLCVSASCMRLMQC